MCRYSYVKELTTPEEAAALVWARLKAHVNSENSFPASFYKALMESWIASCKEPAIGEVKEGDGASLDESLFEDSILPLGLKDMTSSIAKILLLQATAATGKLMTETELLQLIKEPKYSADGRISRLERASRALSIYTETSEVLDHPVSTDTETSEVLDFPLHLKSKRSGVLSHSVSIDTEMSSKPGRALLSPRLNTEKPKRKGPEIELV